MQKTTIQSLLFSETPIKVLQFADIDAVWHEQLEKNQHIQTNPYWIELWPSAIVLSQFIAKNEPLFVGKEVLEIGCGMALPSLVAAKVGAKVTASDCVPNVEEILLKNIALNQIQALNFKVIDWQNPHPNDAADILLASDIAYEKEAFEYLPKAFKTLCKPNGKIILTEPNRQFAQPFLQHFKNMDFQVEWTQQKIEWKGINYAINILVLSL